MEPVAATSTPWPTEVRLRKDKTTLAVRFDSGEAFEFPAEFLRVHSPSAEVQGHGPSERRTVGGKRDVAIVAVEPVGHYAAKLVFDDGHDSGLFTWDTLHALGAEYETRWRAYLAALAAKGLSRDK